MDTITATKSYDTTSHITWLAFADRLSTEHFTELCKVMGWRYSRYRQQFYNNRRLPQYPAWLITSDDGTVAYAAERADRLTERAAKHEAIGNEAYTRTRAMMDVIPFGQPILVGHYSENGDRAYRSKIDHMARKSYTEQGIAESLTDRAKSSEVHQAHMHRPSVIARRIERLETDLRRCHNPEYAAVLDQDLAVNRAELASLGGLPVDDMDVKAGDYVIAAGYGICKVLKVCKKSLSCDCIGSDFLHGLYPKGYPVNKTRVTRKLTEEEVAVITH